MRKKRTTCPLCGTHPTVKAEKDGAWVSGAVATCECTRKTVYTKNRTLRLPEALVEKAKTRWFKAIAKKQSETQSPDLFGSPRP